MKLNLGCGLRKLEGYLNVDKFEACAPDMVADLEEIPWPWQDNAVDEVVMRHVLEHLGERNAVYLGILKELYRVCRPGARITITVPHPNHDDYTTDPTHVRPVTVDSFQLLSKSNCRDWQEKGIGNTPLALYLDVDFEIVGTQIVLDEPWGTQHTNGTISEQDLAFAMRHHLNVIKETTSILTVVKS